VWNWRRGEVMVSGYYGRKIEGRNSSRVWYIVQADPKVVLSTRNLR
jgi:hypothetical protein